MSGLYPQRNPSPQAAPPAGTGRVAFAAFTGLGLATLAAVVLLPEYAALARLRARRDALARRVDCERRLLAYNDRLIRAQQTDPVLAARLMIRHGRYRPVHYKAWRVSASRPMEPVPERIWQEASAAVSPPRGAAYRAALWLEESRTRTSLMILALGAIAVGVLLFGPSFRRPPEEAGG